MKNKCTFTRPAFEKRKEYHPTYGFRVKTGIHSGAWRCTACAGQTVGSNIIKPKCDYCELS
jgi:hypothetical protein